MFDVRRKSHVQEDFQKESPLYIFRVPYALKNSSINFFFRSKLRPLWFLSLFFKLEKEPSNILVVLGMPSSLGIFRKWNLVDNPLVIAEFYNKITPIFDVYIKNRGNCVFCRKISVIKGYSVNRIFLKTCRKYIRI